MNPPYVCILDFEATCDDTNPYYDSEIIEFPSVLLKFNNTISCYDIISEFQQYCKPLLNSELTNFCIELTGITQTQVNNNGGNFPAILQEHYEWLTKQTVNASVDDIIFVTCGNWDLGKIMIFECKKWATDPPPVYQKFINISDPFKTFYKIEKKGDIGMIKMLEYLNIQLEGKHHSGIDDCKNTAKIWQKMIVDGYQLDQGIIQHVDKKLYKIAHPNCKKELEKNKKRMERLNKL